MAESYDKTLEIFKQLQKGTPDISTVAPSPKRGGDEVLSGNIESLTEAVYGKYVPTEQEQKTDGSKVLVEALRQVETGNISPELQERIKTNAEKLKLPKEIVESILRDPLISTKVNGKDEIDVFAQKLVKKNSNIEASNKIIQKLNEVDTPKVQQQPQATQTNIDYNRIQQMIEETIDRKLKQFVGTLNESRKSNGFPITMIQEIDGGKFLFADTSANVYECTLKYKGKNKQHTK